MKENISKGTGLRMNTSYSLGRYKKISGQMAFKIKMVSRLVDQMWLSKGCDFLNRQWMLQKGLFKTL